GSQEERLEEPYEVGQPKVPIFQTRNHSSSRHQLKDQGMERERRLARDMSTKNTHTLAGMAASKVRANNQKAAARDMAGVGVGGIGAALDEVAKSAMNGA